MLLVIGLVVGVLIAVTATAGAFALYRWGQRAATKSAAAAVVVPGPEADGANAVARYGFGPRDGTGTG